MQAEVRAAEKEQLIKNQKLTQDLNEAAFQTNAEKQARSGDV